MTDTGVSPLIADLVAHLRGRLEGLRPGERLPTVRRLMSTFGVSQLTVQKAMARLREEGLVAAHVGRGTFATSGLTVEAEQRNVLVITREQQTERSDEVARALHRAFLEREWRSAVLTYADPLQAAALVRNAPRFDACVIHPRLETLPLELLAAVRARSDAVVVEGYGVEGVDVDRVAVDWRAAVELGLRHLIDLGHRRVGFVTIDRPTRQFLATASHFKTLLRWAEMPDGANPVILLPPDAEETMFASLRSRLQKFNAGKKGALTGIVVYPGAFHGRTLLNALSSASQKVAVVALGFPDLGAEHVGTVTMTGCSTGQLAQAIAHRIEQRWAQPQNPFQTHLLAPELVVRTSSSQA